MNELAAKSYSIAYNSIERFLSIVFIHNYLLTWSIALIISFILPLLFICAPSSLHTTRTSYFLMICIVCLANMCCLYMQIYLISGKGEPNLSYHTCRFIVYISTFAKPIGIYFTLLFSIERIIQKFLSKSFLRTNLHRKLFQQLFKLMIFIGIISIFSIRLYEVMKLIPRYENSTKQILNNTDPRDSITDTTNNSTDNNVDFQFCFRSVNIHDYATILSFYVIQYWFEYTALIIIILIFIIISIQQYRLPRTSSSRFSINTKLYLSLSLCLIISELIILFFHFIVDDYKNQSTDLQLRAIQLLLFAFNFRCIFLPLIICMTICDALKEFIYELFIHRPYLDNIEENDQTNSIEHRSEPFASAQRTNNRLRRTFTKNNNNNNNNNNEYHDRDEAQEGL